MDLDNKYSQEIGFNLSRLRIFSRHWLWKAKNES